jgi:hypothetical protein
MELSVSIIYSQACHLVFAEYMQSGRARSKTDVYSFGVLVLSILSGNTDSAFIEKGLNIVGWVSFFHYFAYDFMFVLTLHAFPI